MSTHDSGPSDPTADPTAAPRTDPTTTPTTNPSFDPTADPTVTASDTAAAPAATTQIPATSTQALPAHSPFRVEPSTPVPDDVVTLVGTHATTSPVKSADPEAWILHYADLFACDHAFRLAPGTVPFFQRT